MLGIDWESLKQAVAEQQENVTKNALPDAGKPLEIVAQGADRYYQRTQKLRLIKYIAFQHNLKSSEENSLIICSLINEYEELSTRIEEDICELNKCFKAGAYKATLIMAGSILEAFLLDWLSEIDGKNYFEQPYKVKVTDKNGNVKWEKKESLSEYIEQIKEIEKPEWMESSQKAHYIREQRNSVHAKVYLKSGVDINEETCEKVMNYLIEIIQTRLNKQRCSLEACALYK